MTANPCRAPAGRTAAGGPPAGGIAECSTAPARIARSLCAAAMLFALAAGVVGGAVVPARAEQATVAIVSDIHFNPFAEPSLAPALAGAAPSDWRAILAQGTQAVSPHGEDTNEALLDSALAALGQAASGTEMVIVTGDLLAHRFGDLASQALNVPPDAPDARAMAAQTALYVMSRLRGALPGKPIVMALGNNDSECGDYRITPDGAFLAATRETVRQLAGPERVAEDFNATYTAGGYYAARHPGRERTTLVVVNDVLWSTEYQNACGAGGDGAADAMLAWLAAQLDRARADGHGVWLVRHIPSGIDEFASFHANAPTCQAQTRPFLREPYAARLALLLREHAATIQASFAGHTHQDSYRLTRIGDRPVGVEKIVPSISPIFGNNPGFHLFSYDRQSGIPSDFSTWWMDDAARTPRPEWRLEYIFSKAYGQDGYSASAVSRVVNAMSGDGPEAERLRSLFGRYYPVGGGTVPAAALPTYLCSLANLDPVTFDQCRCRR